MENNIEKVTINEIEVDARIFDARLPELSDKKMKFHFFYGSCPMIPKDEMMRQLDVGWEAMKKEIAKIYDEEMIKKEVKTIFELT